MKIMQTVFPIILFSAFLGGCAPLSLSDSACIKTVLISTLSKTPLYPAIPEDARTVTISAFKGGCGGSSADLPGGKGDIGITMTLTVPEAKQKHGKVKKIAVPVFVALLDKEDNILDRQDNQIQVTISNQPLNHTHKIIYHPPQGIDSESQDHRILVGFNGRVIPVQAPVHAPVIRAPAVKKHVHKKKRKRKGKRKGISRKIAQ